MTNVETKCRKNNECRSPSSFDSDLAGKAIPGDTRRTSACGPCSSGGRAGSGDGSRRSTPSAANCPIRSFSIFSGSFSRGQPEPAADPGDVRIDHHADGNAIGRAQDHVGRLPPDAGQLHQLLDLPRHLAVVLLQQDAAAVLDALGLVAEKAGALDVAFQLGQPGPGVVGRRADTCGTGSLVTWLTRTSVHWAERIVATSNSRGDWKSSEQVASGYCLASRRAILAACRLASAGVAMSRPRGEGLILAPVGQLLSSTAARAAIAAGGRIAFPPWSRHWPFPRTPAYNCSWQVRVFPG